MTTEPTLYERGQGYYAYRNKFYCSADCTGVTQSEASFAWVPTDTVRVEHLLTGMAVLLEDIAYITADGRLCPGRMGLLFDGGSKPKITQPIIGHPWNEYLLAYTVHDQAWDDIRTKLAAGDITAAEAQRELRQADKDFYEGMRWLKQNKLDRAGNRWERFVVRAKFAAVRIRAWAVTWGRK